MTEAGYGKDDDQVAFADGYPLLLIGQASLEDLSQKSDVSWKCCVFGRIW
jgi:uncharacterized protein YcbX